MILSLEFVTMAEVVPKVTFGLLKLLMPVMVTGVPPVTNPEFGAMLVMARAVDRAVARGGVVEALEEAAKIFPGNKEKLIATKLATNKN